MPQNKAKQKQYFLTENASLTQPGHHTSHCHRLARLHLLCGNVRCGAGFSLHQSPRHCKEVQALLNRRDEQKTSASDTQHTSHGVPPFVRQTEINVTEK